MYIHSESLAALKRVHNSRNDFLLVFRWDALPTTNRDPEINPPSPNRSSAVRKKKWHLTSALELCVQVVFIFRLRVETRLTRGLFRFRIACNERLVFFISHSSPWWLIPKRHRRQWWERLPQPNRTVQRDCLLIVDDYCSFTCSGWKWGVVDIRSNNATLFLHTRIVTSSVRKQFRQVN